MTTPIINTTRPAANPMATALEADPSKLTDYWNSNPGAIDTAFSQFPTSFAPQTTGGGDNPGYSYVAPNLGPDGMNWDGKDKVSWVGSGEDPGTMDSWLQSEQDRFGSALPGGSAQPGTQGGSWGIADEIQSNPDRLEEYWRNNPDMLSEAIRKNPGAFNPEMLQRLTGGSQGDYDKYIDTAFGNARRLLDPYMEQDRSRFEQSMINKGFAPSTEGYNTSYDQMNRGHNDLMNDAVFESMGFGAGRLDKDRSYDLANFSSMDAINRAWDGIDFRNASYGDSRSDQQFNQMASLLGLTPTGSFTPYNMNSAFQGEYNSDAYNNAMNNNMWSNIGTDVGNAAAGVDWGNVWGDVKGIFGNEGNTSIYPTY